MKNSWTKLGAVALAGIVIFNTFIPVAIAADADPSPALDSALIDTKDVEGVKDSFSVKDKIADFGRVSELGRSYTKQIDIVNDTVNDAVIDASVAKYEGVSESNAKLADWLVFVGGVSHFTVSKGQTRSLSVRAAVPEGVTAGSQYATVKLTDSDGHTQVVTVKMDIAGDGLVYASDVADSWIDPVALTEKLNARATVKNTGTAGFTSTYQVKYKNVFGGSDWVVLKEVSEEVFPGKEVKFTSDDTLGFGIYAIEQRATFVNSEGRLIESLLSRTVVNLPWWSLAIAGGVIILIILIIIFAKRRKKGKKNSDKMKKEERKARKAEINKIEAAEAKAISEEKEDRKKEAAEADEIEEIAEELENGEANPVDDDSEFDEEEAVPIKINVRKG